MESFHWNLEWELVTLLDPETQRRVAIDGHTRAVQLYSGILAKALAADQQIKVITGQLDLWAVRVAKAIYPLWR
jgi:hypothetical protein